jgi:hypothetical protein
MPEAYPTNFSQPTKRFRFWSEPFWTVSWPSPQSTKSPAPSPTEKIKSLPGPE